jgi:CDP-glucose 4,6-dehydratase
MIDKDFWKGKNVFLTGHTGFKGSWLSIWLTLMGANVTGYALDPPTEPSLYKEANIAQIIQEDIRADIRDLATVKKSIKQVNPDIVIHMAAQPLVRESYIDPVTTYETNVIGTVNLLEAVRSLESARAVVNITTDKCYENREWYWGYREGEPMGGYDPYSSSKGCSELVTSAYRLSFFNPEKYGENHMVAIATARAGNVIGGGDYAKDRLIPDIIRGLQNKETILIRSPKAIRPWQHVLEPLSGYLLLAQKLFTEGVAFSESWNFGPEDSDAKPVEWIVKELCEYWGCGAGYEIKSSYEQLHEAKYLKLDISKARHKLGWTPKWGIKDALKRVVEWNHNKDPFEITKHQISQYNGY